MNTNSIRNVAAKNAVWLTGCVKNGARRDFTRATAVFGMKDVAGSFPNAYEPAEVEAGWYSWWLENNLFRYKKRGSDDHARKERVFTMVLPPPNITGDLHLGHALTISIQDALVRWHKAKGYDTLWIPGYDHAGIATQIVIEKKIEAQTGRRRNQVETKEFLQEADKWKEQKMSIIRNQLQRLGSSLDWSRECFTMDEAFSEAVNEAFVRLHEEGLITRRKTLVNWCCYLRSAISDIEVDSIGVTPNSTYKIPGYHKPINVGKLTYFAYRLATTNGSEELIVATSRPETVLGDSAVAVNPADHRYSKYVGQYVRHSFDDRLLPVIADDTVDPKFGSGCVKVTPAHDHRDFEIAQRHDLPLYDILSETGHIVSSIERFNGVFRFEARETIVDEMQQLGILRGQEGHETTLPVCSRSGDIVEPLLRQQWYLDCSEMATELIKDVELGRVSFHPESGKHILLNWLADRRKWCISRQLWWGHKIPVYYIADPENKQGEETWVVGRNLEEAGRAAALKLGRPVPPQHFIRESNVLDTWFSSALFPFAVFGWPKQNVSEFCQLYPLSLMETGHDIIFFWVARMAMLGRKLVGCRPFDKVSIHGLVCDSHGRKMSKSLGNVIDPMDVLQGASLTDLFHSCEGLRLNGYISEEELKKAKKNISHEYPNGIPTCGADALRFALLSQDVSSSHVNTDIKYVHSCRKFCNKIWQACKFYVLTSAKYQLDVKDLKQISTSLSPFDLWILSKLSNLVSDCNASFSSNNLNLVARALRQFWYFNLCDVYLEGIKPVLDNADGSHEAKEAIVGTLFACIQTACIALSPVMPFLTEELYHRLNLHTTKDQAKAKVSVSLESYPEPDDWNQWHNPELEETFSDILGVVMELRRIRINYGIQKANPEVYVVCADNDVVSGFRKFCVQLEALSRCEIAKISDIEPTFQGLIRRNVNHRVFVKVNLEGVLNYEEVTNRLCQRRDKLRKELNGWVKKRDSPRYLKTTPAEMQETVRNRMTILEDELRQLQIQIDEMQELLS